jgi:hypothetical protein
MDVAEMNHLRRTVKRLWASGDRPTPLLHFSDEEGDRASIGQAFQTLCSEIGVRHVRIDLAEGLSQSHLDVIAKTARHPRMVVITRIDGLQDEDRTGFHELLCKDASKTLPVVVGFGPADLVASTREAWAELERIKARNARYEAALPPGYEDSGVL